MSVDLSTACAALGIATREAIAIDQARAALSKVTPPGAWALVEARVIHEQRSGATPLEALQRVAGWIAAGWAPKPGGDE